MDPRRLIYDELLACLEPLVTTCDTETPPDVDTRSPWLVVTYLDGDTALDLSVGHEWTMDVRVTGCAVDPDTRAGHGRNVARRAAMHASDKATSYIFDYAQPIAVPGWRVGARRIIGEALQFETRTANHSIDWRLTINAAPETLSP